MANTSLDTPLTVGILILEEQIKEIRAGIDEMVNENGPQKDKMESGFKEDTEALKNLIDKGLPVQESEMVVLEAADDEMEKSFTTGVYSNETTKWQSCDIGGLG
ncbi:Hypothetical predicted protein [Podarcis lilfordi]|uniref:Uncharacterized protein n=1 Tax=Podarcis lilfordi TaxID=74358 RepID=A0AA35K756_9SAUR|nr:Hypothetical predicted protein [Podarcis lilfordi]